MREKNNLWRRIILAAVLLGLILAGFFVYLSSNRTQEPSSVKPNAFRLRNMLGNVMEYCSDFYAEKAYSEINEGELDPKGPQEGKEYVVRGGNYASDAADLRCAARAHTEHDAWRHDRRRRVSAHAACIRTFVSVVGTLVILRRNHRHDGLAVREHAAAPSRRAGGAGRHD